MLIDVNKVKIFVTVPLENVEEVRNAVCEAGAGIIGNYSYCTTSVKSVGSFIPNDKANPHIGTRNKLEFVDEEKLEVICDIDKVKKVISALRKAHSYEEPAIEDLLKKRQAEIEHNKKLYGKSYIHNFDEYVFVDDYGDIIFPDWVTNNFRLILKRNNLKHIRFHDLRHSCASLLLANNVPMKNIQEWLGHANYNTTADVYSHLDFSSKLKSGDIISTQLSEYDYKTALHDDDLELEIKRLNKLLKEKEALLAKKKVADSGME